MVHSYTQRHGTVPPSWWFWLAASSVETTWECRGEDHKTVHNCCRLPWCFYFHAQLFLVLCKLLHFMNFFVILPSEPPKHVRDVNGGFERTILTSIAVLSSSILCLIITVPLSNNFPRRVAVGPFFLGYHLTAKVVIIACKRVQLEVHCSPFFFRLSG